MKHTLYCSLALLLLLTSGCYKPKHTARISAGNYVVALRTQGASGTSDYLVLADKIDDESTLISADGNGKEQLGWSYYSATPNTVISFNYDAPYRGVAYNASLTEKGTFTYDRADCFGAGDDDNTIVTVAAPWGGGTYDCQIYLVDDQMVGIKKRKTTPLYRTPGKDTLNRWPTSIIVNDGKVYISFYPLEGTTWETAQTDTAMVSVYSYPGLDSITTLKDTRTGPIGYYGNPSVMVKTENGDIYTFSSTSLTAGFTQSTKPSAVMRIRSGQLQFDESYFFNIEAATGGGKLLNGHYAGNGLVVGQLIIPGKDIAANAWAAVTPDAAIYKLVVVDLYNKTVKDVAGVPPHGGQFSTPGFVEDGKVYRSVTTSDEGRVYVVDAATATAKKGAKFNGEELPGIYKIAK